MHLPHHMMGIFLPVSIAKDRILADFVSSCIPNALSSVGCSCLPAHFEIRVQCLLILHILHSLFRDRQFSL